MSVALSAYRSLMRSARIAFQGDAPILAAAQGQIRSEFRQKASLDPTDDSIPAAIQRAEEVAKVLRENVVQGKKVEEGQDRYSTSQPGGMHASRRSIMGTSWLT
ncbi:Mitochondrial zinc maintenance protein 1, mitochondrial [Neonectria magnoliae]|uniref:Mitochondrial zinc maintenance protein 1, mitochondrial n=1 Tax=Neonectria magnoliae TaxID=2732573 RepID=A0ABR1I560_9HYPO